MVDAFTYRIGSMNLFKYSAVSKREKNETIAKIILDNKFDIVALQEIFVQEALDNLLECLNLKDPRSQWLGSHASPERGSRSTMAAEGYAFVWNSSIFRPVEYRKEGRLIRIAQPRIYDQYIGKKTNPLIRPPFYARFEPVNGPHIEFRLLNTHIIFSLNRNQDEHSDDTAPLTNGMVRRSEFHKLAENMFPKIYDHHYGNQVDDNGKEIAGVSGRVAYTLIMGDYNLNLQGHGSPFIEEFIDVRKEGQHPIRIRTIQSEPTTLKMPPSPEKQEPPTEKTIWSHNYDHFSYNDPDTGDKGKMIYINSHRIDTLSKYFDGDIKQHRELYSDHVPIYADIKFRKD